MDLFNLPAKRPKFSAMSNQQISDLTGAASPHGKKSAHFT
jgi:dTDP-4-dehydrorhamnose reductase